MSTFKYDDFEQLRTSLTDIEGVVDSIATEAVEAIEQLIQQEFASGTDPYGNAWNAPNNLNDTGAMLSSLIVMVDGKEIFMSIDEPANFHQSGTYKMPQRIIFPLEGELPDSWNAILENTANKNLSDKIGGK